mgnify:FL=1
MNCCVELVFVAGHLVGVQECVSGIMYLPLCSRFAKVPFCAVEMLWPVGFRLIVFSFQWRIFFFTCRDLVSSLGSELTSFDDFRTKHAGSVRNAVVSFEGHLRDLMLETWRYRDDVEEKNEQNDFLSSELHEAKRLLADSQRKVWFSSPFRGVFIWTASFVGWGLAFCCIHKSDWVLVQCREVEQISSDRKSLLEAVGKEKTSLGQKSDQLRERLQSLNDELDVRRNFVCKTAQMLKDATGSRVSVALF